MLKTTARLLTGWMIVIVALWAATAWAQDAARPAGMSAGSASGVADRGDAKRQQAADLLRRARQAMSENDLGTAESLVTQAESLGLPYGPLHVGDTPQRARRDLEQRKMAAKFAPAKPSQFALPGAAKKAPTADPFTGRVEGSLLPQGNQLSPLPQVEAPSPIKPLATNDPTKNPLPFGKLPETLNGDLPATAPAVPAALADAAYRPAGAAAPAAAGNNSELLRAARRALAVGDVKRAVAALQQAKASPARYAPLDDTPEKVEAAILKYQEVVAQGRNNNTEIYRRTFARTLMEQSEALLHSGDLAEAEQLAAAAQKQHVTFGPLEARPDDLLNRIAAAKRGDRGTAAGAGAGPGIAQAGDGRASVALGAVSTAAAGATSANAGDALELVRQARAALQAGQLPIAEQLAIRAERLRLPDAAYPPADRPGQILYEIRAAKTGSTSATVVPASANLVTPAGGTADLARGASRAVYDPTNDPTRNVTASINLPAAPRGYQLSQLDAIPSPAAPAAPGPTAVPAAAPPTRENQGIVLFREGEEAMKARQIDKAYQLFRQAAQHMNEMDPVTAQRLQDHLQLLAPPQSRPAGAPGRTLADEAAAKQVMLVRSVTAELAQQESKALALSQTDPKGALTLLEEARKKVEAAGLETAARDQLLKRVDRKLVDLKKYMDDNSARIELDDKNKRVRDEVARDAKNKVEIEGKFADMVNEFNRLIDEQRYAEAEVVAKRAAELNPREPVAQQLLLQSKMVRRFMTDKTNMADKEDGFVRAMQDVDKASVAWDTSKSIEFPKDWRDMVKNRAKFLAERNKRRSERDLEIERKLRSPVSLSFANAPLSKVLEHLAKVADVNLHLDPKGLAEEGVLTETPVTIQLQGEIMLKSALNLILEPLHLSYVIKDEVLKITSVQMRHGETYPVTYNVADLVIPIPNFIANPRMGLAGAYHDAMAQVGYGGGTGPWGPGNAPLAVVASHDGRGASGMINPAVLAQQMSHPALAGAQQNQPGQPHGPGGLGGGAQADFDSLIQLITSTVAPTTWDDVGGPGSIAPFETNLSIVVSQTQAVHEQIVDLLEQLRRLQDLQVTIEVRFITLTDNFFERIGVDFDFDIDDNIDGSGRAFGSIVQPGNPIGPPATEPIRNTLDEDRDNQKNMTVGLTAPNTFSADMDIPFTQNSFALAQPQFGGFDATAGAQLGFAILSDIEAFFFINAASGDRRTNILQAPKVTLFNGQQAFISDTSQTPFVISLIPVVGDFAAAQQPVIVVLSEGTHLTVQAVVSDDRRYVRLTVVPFFSKIGKDVRTFQFAGSTTTTTDTSNEGWVNPLNAADRRRNNDRNNSTTTRSGTSVQLPTFSFVTVTTTVSVPDGGTVLLGGIKRLSEERREFGVPILKDVPFINRLFKNVGIGKDTSTLMMMVTPRIIIQEEEEERLGIQPPS